MSNQHQRQVDKELLQRWEPVLKFTAASPPNYPNRERFLPMPVEPFVEASSLWVEYHLFGFFRLRGHLVIEAGKLRAETLETPSKGGGLWDKLCGLSFISRQASLRFVQENDRKAYGDRLPKKAPPPEEEEKARSELRETGTGCLIATVFILLPLSVLVARVWSLKAMLMVDAALILLGLWALLGSQRAYLSAQNRYFGMGCAVFGSGLLCALFNGLVLSPVLDGLRPLGWVFYCFAYLGLFYGVLFILAGLQDFLRRAITWLSPLPDETADIAALKYADLKNERGFKPTYYGRVWQPQGDSQWRHVVQYWLFYAMNDWRTSEGGLDDHEGDWEMVQVCVPKDPSEPATVAYSQHSMSQTGPLTDGTAIAYIAAGSHACYPKQEAYRLSVMVAGKKGLLSPMAWLALILRLSERAARWFSPTRRLEQYRKLTARLGALRDEIRQVPGGLRSRAQKATQGVSSTVRDIRSTFQAEGAGAAMESVIKRTTKPARRAQGSIKAGAERLKNSVSRVPIVDRATDEGETVTSSSWNGQLLDADAAWVRFQGRWGRSVIYPPESGPGGPRYHQDGSERLQWRDPIAWAGLKR